MTSYREALGLNLEILGPYAPADLETLDLLPRTTATYAALPAIYRRTDAGLVAKALVAAMVELTAFLEVIVDAVDFRAPDDGGPTDGSLPGGASLLTDPQHTPWTTWLAQAVGVDLAAAGIVDPLSQAARDAITTPVNGWRAGSRAALETAGRRTLSGNRTIIVRPNETIDPFVITVSTAATETDDPAALEAAVRAVLPAGHDLAFDNNVGDWAGVEAAEAGPTALEVAAPTWADVEQLYA